MPFKKLNNDIVEQLNAREITTPTPFQKVSIPSIKSGGNIFCTAPKDSGKTTTLIVTILQKLKYKEVGEAPRAIVLVENREKAAELYDAFFTYTRYSSVRVYFADEKLHIDVQKSEIFEGTDIIISTPKSMEKLFLSHGLNTSQLSILSIDDAEFLSQKSSYNALLSITESISKCQFVLFAEKMSPSLKRFKSYFMEYSKVVSV